MALTGSLRRGDWLRLRARLVDENGFIVDSLGRTYDLNEPNAIADFAGEFERLTGINIERLFPRDFRSMILDALLLECAA